MTDAPTREDDPEATAADPAAVDPAAPAPPDVDDAERERWVEAQQQVETFLLDGPRSYTRAEVSARSGVAPEHTARAIAT